MLSSFLVNLREYCCSLVQCCQQVSNFIGAPRAHSLSTNYYINIKRLLSHHVGLAGFEEILQHTFDFGTKHQVGGNVLGDHQELDIFKVGLDICRA